ncbi:MAG TPA: hypothetical protein ENI87_09015 [bacterium]|nr:hypothetical protein [bacterium]
MNRFARALSCLPLLASACVVPPDDPFERGEFAVQRDDLLMALHAFDAVPVAHPRYPDARAAAVAVEQRMRRCQELLLEALMLRGEWRDEEALEALRRAQVQWPSQPGLQRWIDATEQRLALFGSRRPESGGEGGEPAAPAPVPLVEVPPATPAPAPVETRERTSTPTATAPPVSDDPVVEIPAEPIEEPPSPPVASAPSHRAGDDPVALGLVAVERLLARAERDRAVRDLTELARRFPGDARVTSRLARLLHQRGLLRYGQGAVAAAIRDWQRVLKLEPGNERVRGLLAAARREAAER